MGRGPTRGSPPRRACAGCGIAAKMPAASARHDPLELDVLDALVALGKEEELELEVVGVDTVDGEAMHVRRVEGRRVGDVYEVEADDVLREIDAARLEPGLVSGAAVVSHSQLVAVQVVDGRHHRLVVL